MKRKYILLFAGLLFLCGGAIARQSEVIEENDVPLRVQAWFYKRYNNPFDLKWSKKQFSGMECFAVSFTHKSRVMNALYDSDGTILEESAVNKKPILSSEIKYYIDKNYDKFKTMSLKSIKIFHKTLAEPTIYYQLVGKAGQDDVSVWFDSDNQIRKKKDFSGYASVN